MKQSVMVREFYYIRMIHEIHERNKAWVMKRENVGGGRRKGKRKG